MRLLIGGFFGCLAGLAVWFSTDHLVSHYGDEPSEANSEAGSEGVTAGSSQAQRHGHGARGAIAPVTAVMQAAMVLWGAYVWWRAPTLDDFLPALVVTALLVTVSLVDLRVRRIPNSLVLALLVWGLVQVIWLGQPALLAALLGVLAGGGLLLLIALAGRGAMGAGDVKFAGALGVVLGYPLILHGLFYGILAGGAAALILLLTRRVGRKDYIAYGPYLALGAWIVWIQARGLWPWA